MAERIVLRIEEATEKHMAVLDEYLHRQLPNTVKWYYLNPKTSVVLVDIRAKEGHDMDRQFFVRSKTTRELASRDITSYKKIQGQVAHSQLLVFLAIPGVHSVFADEAAENFLATVKEAVKPLDHGKKTDVELFFELKTEFIQNNEKDGMTLKAFYKCKWEDEKARYILIDKKNKFAELEDSCTFFKKDNQLKFSLSETIDCHIEDDAAEISGKECLAVICKAGH